MPHVVTERCVDCRYTDCCAVCPVECFYETASPAMLVIDPVTCIDCGLCVPECPIYAIYPKDEVPEPYQAWIQKNKDFFPKGIHITAKKEKLPSAIPIDEIRKREKAKSWSVADPSAVGGGGGGGTAAPAASGAAVSAAVAAPPPPAAGAAPAAEETPVKVQIPKTPPRPPLDIREGGRIRIGYRSGTVQAIRQGPGNVFVDLKVLFDGEERPVWYIYSTLQTYKEKGELEILDPGPKPGLLKRFFGG